MNALDTFQGISLPEVIRTSAFSLIHALIVLTDHAAVGTIHLYCDPIYSSEASGQQQTGVRVYALEKFLRRAAFGRLLPFAVASLGSHTTAGRPGKRSVRLRIGRSPPQNRH
jgi:hypothetical protein